MCHDARSKEREIERAAEECAAVRGAYLTRLTRARAAVPEAYAPLGGGDDGFDAHGLPSAPLSPLSPLRARRLLRSVRMAE